MTGTLEAVKTEITRLVTAVIEDAVRVFLQDAVPDGCVPHVPAQVDAKDGPVSIDGFRIADSLGCQESELMSFDKALR